MSEKKYVVPNGMQRAARDGYEAWRSCARPPEQYTNGAVVAVECALRWLAENPVVPTDEQAHELWHHPKVLNGDEHYAKAMARDWQRMMFLAPEPEVPEDVRDLLCPKPCATRSAMTELAVNEAIIEAYNRGKASK